MRSDTSSFYARGSSRNQDTGFVERYKTYLGFLTANHFHGMKGPVSHPGFKTSMPIESTPSKYLCSEPPKFNALISSDARIDLLKDQYYYSQTGC